jgi:predicted amidophosphoribosyltransferase
MSLIDAMFPVDCAGCGARGRLSCAACSAVLAAPATLVWPRPSPPGLPPPWAVAAYADPCRALLIAYKERDAVGLRAALALALAAAISAAVRATATGPAQRLLVVPVPSTRAAVRARGDDVVLGLTRRAATLVRRSGVNVAVVPALCHGRTVTDSAGLSAAARAANLAGAFAVRRQQRCALAGGTVILADDLITTGVTLAEAARALRAEGAAVVAAATVAATRRRG